MPLAKLTPNTGKGLQYPLNHMNNTGKVSRFS